MDKVSLKGVVIGGVSDIVASNVLAFPLAIYAMIANSITSLPKEQQAAALTSAMTNQPSLYIAGLLLGSACSVLGGYLAARIAKHDEYLNGALSSFLCIAFGVYSIAKGTDGAATWVHILLFVVSPALGALGAHLRVRGVRRGAQASPSTS